jgi:peptide/nickel transport system permease protein
VSRYLVRRLLMYIPVLLGISMILFAILALAPGDPFGDLVANENIPPEVLVNLRKQFGLDDPIHVRYLRWFVSMVQGNWGYSFVSRVPVHELIMQRLPVTLYILGSAYLVALLVAMPVGILSAVKPYSIFDQVATTFAFIGYSLPTFFTGLLFILFFSIYLHWLPFIYSSTIDATGFAWALEQLRQGAMPIAVLGLFQAAFLTRFVRASMLEVINQDFVNTARAKGLHERLVILKHALRNALIPVATVIAYQIPGIFTGALITEQIFRVPGIGSLLIRSIESNDTPVAMAIVFVNAALVIVFNLVVDIVYGFLDPRISYS